MKIKLALSARIYLFLLPSILQVVNCYSQCLLDKSNYQLVWNDEFDYPTNNVNQLSPKWLFHYPWQSPGNTGISWVGVCDRYFFDPSNISLFKDASGNGFAALNSTHYTPGITQNGIEYERSSGILVSRLDDCFNGSNNPGAFYGIFEIRAKLPPEQSGTSAFWLAGGGFEVDVFESDKDWGKESRFFSTIQPSIYNNNIGCSTNYDWLFSDPVDDFHTYTLAWTKDRVTFFIDGMEIRSNDITGGFPYMGNMCGSQKMYMMISMHAMCWNANNWQANNQTGPFIIDYARVYKPIDYTGSPVPETYQFPPYKSKETYNSYDISKDISFVSPDGSAAGLATYEDPSNNLIRVYYGNFNGELQYVEGKITTPAQWTHHLTGITNLSNGSTLTVDPNVGNVFYRGTDGELWVYWNNNGSYQQSSLDIAGNYPDDVDANSSLAFVPLPLPRVYYKSTNGHLSYMEFDINTSPGWTKHATWVNNLADGRLSVGDNVNTPQTGVFYKGTDNELWTFYVDNGTPVNISMDMYNLYPNNVAHSISTGDGRIYYLDQNSTIWYFEWDPVAVHWHKYQSIVPNALGPIVPRPGNDGCFYISTDNDVYSNHVWQGNWVYNKLNFLYADKRASSSLTLSSFGGNRIFYVDNQAHLRYYEWGNCENLNPPCATTTELGLKQGLSVPGSVSKHPPLDQPHISPNPNTGAFTVELPAGLEQSEVVIMDMTGKVIQKQRALEGNTLRFDLGPVARGIYMLHLANGSQNFRTRISVQ